MVGTGKALLNPKEAAEFLGILSGTLAQWQLRSKSPSQVSAQDGRAQ
jgi:hypothetical protein